MKPAVQVDATWNWGPFSAALTASLGAAVTAALEFAFPSAPDALPWMVAGPMAALCLLVPFIRRQHILTGIFQAACWTAAGIWVTWQNAAGLSWVGFVILAVATAAATMLGPAFSAESLAKAEAQSRAALTPAVPPGHVQTMSDVEAGYARLINKGLNIGAKETVLVSDVTPWTNRGGVDVAGEFPAGSLIELGALAELQTKLAAALRLPVGCTVQAVPGAHQGAWRLRITKRDVLAEEVDYPSDYQPRSAREPYPIGRVSYGDLVNIETYQSAGVFAGRRGSGKTVLLHNITAALVQCVDDVVWHADLGGGGIAAPWVMPWAQGRAGRPAVDWAARDAYEALAMAEVGLAIAKDRKARYQRLLIEQNTDVLPIGRMPDGTMLPMITIIVDEGGEVFGEGASRVAALAAAKLRELQRIGRAMCVNVIFSVQRGVATYVDSDMKKGCGVLAVGMVQDDDEVAYMLDWKQGVRAVDLVHKGEFFIKREGDRLPFKFRTWHLLPVQIGQLAVWAAANGTLPELDPAARRIAGDVYADRWTRAAEWLTILRGDADVATVPTAVAPVQTVADPETEPDGPVVDVLTKVRTAIAEGERTAAGDDDEEPTPTDDLLQMLWDLPDAQEPDRGQPAESAVPVTVAEFVLEFLRHNGPAMPSDIFPHAEAAGLTSRRQSISEALGKLEKLKQVTRQPDGWVIREG